MLVDHPVVTGKFVSVPQAVIHLGFTSVGDKASTDKRKRPWALFPLARLLRRTGKN